ncbi:hypothetical protein FACS1894216_12430 [Synergistales bacterium]|nr:hypothetical protein FACS1894216_12430 [Synergistales bacterium]
MKLSSKWGCAPIRRINATAPLAEACGSAAVVTVTDVAWQTMPTCEFFNPLSPP